MGTNYYLHGYTFSDETKEYTPIPTSILSDQILEDEYGRKFTGQDSLNMLEHNCPIEYTMLVGREFC